MNFLDPELENYASSHSSPEPELLAELTRETHLKTTMPRMLSGHLQGRFLILLSKLVNADSILEIATFTGYSTICLSEGLRAGGKVYSIDSNDETTAIAKKYISLAKLESMVELLTGDAQMIIPGLSNTYDLVFIDADKENYSTYYDMVIEKVRPGGLIVADNVLWSGRVVQPVKPSDKETIGLIHFTKKVCADTRVTPLLLPIRDGLMVIRVS